MSPQQGDPVSLFALMLLASQDDSYLKIFSEIFFSDLCLRLRGG